MTVFFWFLAVMFATDVIARAVRLSSSDEQFTTSRADQAVNLVVNAGTLVWLVTVWVSR